MEIGTGPEIRDAVERKPQLKTTNSNMFLWKYFQILCQVS